MNPPKCDDLVLIAAQRVFTCTEAARCQPEGDQAPAHDAFTRLLQRQPPDTAALWQGDDPLPGRAVPVHQEAKAFVNLRKGLLILDDTTLEGPYARRMDLVTYPWSGKHRGVVKGIALLTLLWTQMPVSPRSGVGQARIPLVYRRQSVPKGIVPCDFRVYDKPQDGKTKNDPFQQMLQKAKNRGFEPEYVLMDSGYAGLENLKRIRDLGWSFMARLKGNRLVNPDGKGNGPICAVEIPGEGGASEGLWLRQGVPDGLQRRGRGTLGDGRSGDERREAGRSWSGGDGA